MARKTLTLAVGLLLLAGAAAATAAAPSSGDKMTICHIPPGNPQGARTMQVSRSSWPAHEGHGDHEGACTAADRAAPPQPPAGQPQRPPTSVVLSQRADGDLDGVATFVIKVLNDGPEAAVDVALDGRLRGAGEWSATSPSPVGCAIAQGRLHCGLGDVPAGRTVELRLRFEGGLSLCREAATDLTLSARNDARDDRSQASARVGACSPLEPPADGTTFV